MLPGTTNISFPCSNARAAVLSVPLRLGFGNNYGISKALTIRFRSRNEYWRGVWPASYSLISAPPLSTISLAESSIVMPGNISGKPFASTAIVVPPASSAALMGDGVHP